MSDDKWFDLDAHREETNAFIQWKGTDVCLDFRCECGGTCHFDGYFAYTIECPHCARLWEMPMILFPRPYTGDREATIVQRPAIEDDDDRPETTQGERRAD